VSDECTDARLISALRRLLEAHKCSTQKVHRHALRSGRKLLRLKILMRDEDLYALALFSGGALYHTPYEDLRDLALRLESEQTFKNIISLDKGWFSQARKEYDSTFDHRLRVFTVLMVTLQKKWLRCLDLQL
jgi:hypothetical protein